MLYLTMSFSSSFLMVVRAPRVCNAPDLPPWGHRVPMAQDHISAQPGTLSPCPRDAVGVLVSIPVSATWTDLYSALSVPCLLNGSLPMYAVVCFQPCLCPCPLLFLTWLPGMRPAHL